MHFFLAIHVFFLQCMFLKVLAPIRPRYGPATGPIRPRYGHRSAFFQKFNRQRLAFFEKIGTIYIKNWLELSVVKSLGLICHDLFCFCELYVMEKLVDLCENEKVRNQTSWRYFFWRNAFGKKAAWKQRRWFWGRSSNVSICVCCMSFKQSKIKPFAVLFCGCVFGEFAKKKHARKAHVNSCRHACAIHNVNSYRLGYAPA